MYNERIIWSLLDTDLYKLTMMQAVYHQFPGAVVEYRFKCRNKDVKWTKEHLKMIESQLDYLCDARADVQDLEYLRSIRFLKADFIDFLSVFHLKRGHIKAWLEGDSLEIKVEGSWLFTILFEVPVLAIVNEVYFFDKHTKETYQEGEKRLVDKIEMVRQVQRAYDGASFLSKFTFTDFGTRRRFGRDWQRVVVHKLADELGPSPFVGTSNVWMAKMMNITPVGTMAHEWLQAGQALDVRLVDSQRRMLQAWVDEYRGDLGTALTDVIGIDAFLCDFDLYFAKLYDGVRHDSGDPIVWGRKMVDHYKKLRIDPKTKTLVFSDGLDVARASDIFCAFRNEVKVAFGIGTNLTNDLGLEPLNIVLKMTKCNGSPVAKISDAKGKGMCRDDGYLHYLKQVFQVEG